MLFRSGYAPARRVNTDPKSPKEIIPMAKKKATRKKATRKKATRKKARRGKRK